MLTRYAVLGTFSLILVASLPIHAKETCAPLKVVDGQGTQVTKKVSVPGAPGISNNWNTDFEVPSNSSFTNYIATIKSDSTEAANFDVTMNLKYSDDTADKQYEGTVQLTSGQSKQLTGTPRPNEQPYQVNLNVGGLKATGFSYTLSVKGCEL